MEMKRCKSKLDDFFNTKSGKMPNKCLDDINPT